jgi:hypothetical protein
MYTNSLATLAHCQEVVRRYRLGPADFSSGSVEGFTAYLFCRGMELDGVENLAARLDTYRDEAAAGLDEAELFEDARSLNELLNAHARARREIATNIEVLKGRPGGMELWACVAELATSPAPMHSTICERRGVPFQDVQSELAWLKQFDWLVLESANNLDYVPGNDRTLDGLLRRDIEVFDQTLIRAAPWSGARDDTALEFSAIHRLAP